MDGPSIRVGTGVSVQVNDRGNLVQVLRGGKTGRLLGGKACGMECDAESKPHGTAKMIRRIPSGVIKSVSKK